MHQHMRIRHQNTTKSLSTFNRAIFEKNREKGFNWEAELRHNTGRFRDATKD